jgi:DNA ligase (NAD+)
MPEIICNGKKINLIKENLQIPTHCPACGTLLINDNIRLMCPGDSCVGKNFQRILNFIRVIKIDSFGESLAEKLYEQGKLTNLADIFTLTKEDISSIGGWGEKSAETIMVNIKGLKKMNPAIFLSALGIPSLSTSTAEDLWKKYGSMDALKGASIEDICTIKGYSTISATKIVEGLKLFDDQISEILNHVELLDISKGGKFSGLAFCFTGEMSQPRSYFQGLVTKMGGKNDSTITKATTFLVCNENKGSSKSRKAEQFGVKIINEAQFLEMVGEVLETEKKPKLVTKSLFEE